MVDIVSPYSSQIDANKSKKTSSILIILIVLALIAGAILIFRKSKETEPPIPTVTETQAPTPTKKPEIDKKSVTIQVLNGTGTAGQAGTVVDVLEAAGYDTEKIKTANAEDFDHAVTTIEFKEGFDDIADDIENELKITFDDIEIKSTNLDEDSGFDIVITTGGEKAVEATPTTSVSTTGSDVTPTQTPTPTVTPTPSTTSTPTPTP